MNYQHTKFWTRLELGKWEPETLHILKNYLRKDSVFCDIGAWIGPTSVYASALCKKVVCFEPDPVAFRFLVKNTYGNNLDNVSLYNVALSNETQKIKMSSFGNKLGDSGTSILANDENHMSFSALSLKWGKAVELFELNSIDFIKIDIEGGEFLLLPAMKEYLNRYKPIVLLSLHAPYLNEEIREQKMSQIIDALSAYDFCLDSDLNKININTLIDDSCLNEFKSVLFLDKKHQNND